MIIFKDKTGQLGNNLFEFATFLAIANEHNHWILNLTFAKYAKYFNGTKETINRTHKTIIGQIEIHPKILLIIFKIINKVFGTIIKANSNSYNLEGINWEKNVYFKQGGWFTDFNNFYKHQDILRTYFRPIDCHWNSVQKFILNAKSENEILIGIHIRQGDYKFFQEGKFYFETSVYFEKMQQLSELFPKNKTVFVVASNENLNLDSFRGLNVIFAPNHFLEDMYVLSQCDYIFGPPSTYTMWASFYGKKKLLKLRSNDQRIILEEFQFDYGY